MSLVEATPSSGKNTTGSSEVTARGRTSHVLPPVEVIMGVIMENIMEVIMEVIIIMNSSPVDGH